MISLVLVLAFGLLTGGMFVKYTAPVCNSNVSSPEDKPMDIATAENDNKATKNTDAAKDITYATFSSPKADFTFEYPDMWKYDEREIDGTMEWGFYPNLDEGYNNVPPYLAVQSPIDDPGAVDLCSGGGPDSAKGDPYSCTLSVLPTNDPDTFVNYERYGAGESGGGYIYWEKGEFFANATSLGGHDKYNLMRFYSAPEKGQEIGLHIAQSIKIK